MRLLEIEAVGLIVATTIGAGIFALPAVLDEAGTALFVAELVLLAVLVVFAQALYWRVLKKTGLKLRLTGLVRDVLGMGWGWFAALAVLGGMLLVLIAYLLLGAKFLSVAWPALTPGLALLIFWAIAAIPALLASRRFAVAESVGSLIKFGIVIFIFWTATRLNLPQMDFEITNILLPFGTILFALTGWNAIEPILEIDRRRALSAWKILIIALSLIAFLYLLFAAGAPQSLEGKLLAVFVLIVVWTAFPPAAREIENTLIHDFRWSKNTARAAWLLAPLILVWFGAVDFVTTLSFAGAVFIGAQYVVILRAALKELNLGAAARAAAYLSMVIFAFAAIWEIYVFLI